MITVVIDNGCLEDVYPTGVQYRLIDKDTIDGECPICGEELSGAEQDRGLSMHKACEDQLSVYEKGHPSDTLHVSEDGRIAFSDEEIKWVLDDGWCAYYKDEMIMYTGSEKFPSDDLLAEAALRAEKIAEKEKLPTTRGWDGLLL